MDEANLMRKMSERFESLDRFSKEKAISLLQGTPTDYMQGYNRAIDDLRHLLTNDRSIEFVKNFIESMCNDLIKKN